MPAPVCAEELERLYGIIAKLMAGQAEVTVSFDNRSVTYAQGQLKELRNLYSSFYRQCGADSGYPNLALAIERGPPMRF